MANRGNFVIMKVKMFITSYFPLYIILLLLQAREYPLTFSFRRIDWPATVTGILLIFMMIISIGCTAELFKTQQKETHYFQEFERTGDMIISYMMTYIVPLLADYDLEYNWFVVNLSIFILIGIMYVKLDLLYFNPLWLLLGYAIYTAEGNRMIISNIPYGTLKQNQGRPLEAVYIVRSVYLIRKKDNKL